MTPLVQNRQLASAATELVQRRPVWHALSDLFLDTEPSDPEYRYIASVLARSPYRLEQLEAILFGEVYPVCIRNLWAAAGVWQRFDQEWLEASILARARRWLRWPVCLQMSRWAVLPAWRRIKEQVTIMRAGPAAAETTGAHSEPEG